MAKPIKPRPLHDHKIEIIRLVACGYTNAQLAVEFDVPVETIRARMHTVHQLIGSASADGSDNASRIRMVIWAYDNRIVRPKGARALVPVEKREPLPQERVPAELAAPMIRLSIAILSDEPRGDLKAWARRVMEAARLTMPKAMGRPTSSADAERAAA